MKMREQYTCPLELTHDMLKGKWKPIILWQLSKGTGSFASLKKEIKGISQKMLIQHLNELLTCGIICKTAYEGYPLRVDYYLTQRGRKLFDAISIMQEVGFEIMGDDSADTVTKK